MGMNREQAINYLINSGFSEEQINEIAKALEPTTKNDLGVDAVSRAEAQTKIEIMHKYQQLEDFAKWVAVEVIDEELWTYNHLSFAEIACRKLVKLGIMQESDGEYTYEVVEDGNDKRREI